jgi:hypothetical protein
VFENHPIKPNNNPLSRADFINTFQNSANFYSKKKKKTWQFSYIASYSMYSGSHEDRPDDGGSTDL